MAKPLLGMCHKSQSPAGSPSTASRDAVISHCSFSCRLSKKYPCKKRKEKSKHLVLPMCPVSSDYRLPAAHIKAQALPHAIAACESPQASHDELHMWHMGQTHAPGRLHAPGAHMAAAGTPWSLCMGFWHAASTPAG